MMFPSQSRQWILLPFLCLFPVLAESSLQRRLAFSRTITPLAEIRGGSTTTTTHEDASATPTKDLATQKYTMEQLLLLQTRSNRLRQALTERGVLQDYSQLDAPTTAQPVDWDCALSTLQHPKSCLYSFDAEPNTKVLAPTGTTQYISLSQLNRLRRTDPTKVEPLWHSQYAIFKSWFRVSSPYSLYAYLPWQGYFLAVLLDVPLVLNMVVVLSIYSVLALTRVLWEPLINMMLTSSFLWQRWPSWARFVHAALPLKLMLGQLAWGGLSSVYGKIKGRVRDHLIQMECRIWEEAIPLTILEGPMLERYNNNNNMEKKEVEEEESIVAGVAEEEDSEDDETEDSSEDDSDASEEDF